MITQSQIRAMAPRILKEALERFQEKSIGYDSVTFDLGAKGVFSDVFRKTGKLKGIIWDEKDPGSEDAVEVCQDMIGHLLIIIGLLEGTAPALPDRCDHIMSDGDTCGASLIGKPLACVVHGEPSPTARCQCFLYNDAPDRGCPVHG